MQRDDSRREAKPRDGVPASGQAPGWLGRRAERQRRELCLELAIRLFESSQDEDDSERLAHVLAAARAFEAYLQGERPRDGKPELLQFPGAKDRP